MDIKSGTEFRKDCQARQLRPLLETSVPRRGHQFDSVLLIAGEYSTYRHTTIFSCVCWMMSELCSVLAGSGINISMQVLVWTWRYEPPSHMMKACLNVQGAVRLSARTVQCCAMSSNIRMLRSPCILVHTLFSGTRAFAPFNLATLTLCSLNFFLPNDSWIEHFPLLLAVYMF